MGKTGKIVVTFQKLMWLVLLVLYLLLDIDSFFVSFANVLSWYKIKKFRKTFVTGLIF